MTISGFTMVRNAKKFYFPVKQSIESILPVVDEFIVALGEGEDNTEEMIRSINSPKIKIYKRKWDERFFKDSHILKVETDFALSKCRGDWCFYLQADEAVHEKDLPVIREYCKKHLNNPSVEGFLFNYLHFWGDYDHVLDFHGWYRREIRIIRNNSGIQSYKDAQSFRKNGEKINVVELPAHIYHYGWVRPPELMASKRDDQDTIHAGKTPGKSTPAGYFDYGPLGKIPVFKGTHPQVMREWMQRLNWKDKLNYGKKAAILRPLFKHEKLKYRLLTLLEKKILRGREIFGYSNWKRRRG